MVLYNQRCITKAPFFVMGNMHAVGAGFTYSWIDILGFGISTNLINIQKYSPFNELIGPFIFQPHQITS